MIDVLRLDEKARVADINFQHGCPICGGDLVVRTTPRAGWSHCRSCRRIARSNVAVTPVGVQLIHPLYAHA
jgi:hypothetical protein